MPENFKELVDVAMQQLSRAAMRPAVEKEILHYDIFYALDREWRPCQTMNMSA